MCIAQCAIPAGGRRDARRMYALKNHFSVIYWRKPLSVLPELKMEFLRKIRKTAESAGIPGRAGWLFPLLLLLTGICLTAMAAWAADEAYADSSSSTSTVCFANDLDDNAPASRVRNGSSLLRRILSRGTSSRSHHFEVKFTAAILCTANQVSAGLTGIQAHRLPPCRNLLLLQSLKSSIPARAAPLTV